MTTQPQASVCDMKRCNWAFLVKGPRSSLECLPSANPWWSIAFSTDRSEWEAFIPDYQDEADSNRQFDLAMQAITRMNGLAVSSGQPGLIEMTHLATYDPEDNRTVAIPLKLAIKVTNLGGLGPTKPAAWISQGFALKASRGWLPSWTTGGNPMPSRTRGCTKSWSL